MVALAVRAEIAGALRYKLASVDHFTLNAQGKVTRRSPSFALELAHPAPA
jgi:hypothetical protein